MKHSNRAKYFNWWASGAFNPLIANIYADGGQSNDEGQAPTTGLPAQYTGPLKAYTYHTYGSGSNVRNSTNMSWQRLELGKNNNSSGVNGVAQAGVMGPEINFGKLMGDLRPNNTFFVKYAAGSSTRLGEGGTNDWKVGAGGNNYANLMQNGLLLAIPELISDFGLTPMMRGFDFYQGEAERAGAVGFPNAAAVQAAMYLQGVRIIQSFIDDLVEAGVIVKNLRIGWGRIHNNFTDADPLYLAAVRQADMDIVANILTDKKGYAKHIAGIRYIDTDGFGIQADHIHLDQSGQLSFGQSRFDYYKQFVDENRILFQPVTTGFDSEAIAIINAAALDDQTQANAVNTFVTSAKSGGWWSKFLAIYGFIGGDRRGHKLNWKDPSNALGYNLTFNTGFNHGPEGFWGDGTSGLADTHIPLSALGQNTAGMFVYVSGSVGQEAQYGNGALAVGNACRLYISPRWTDNNAYISCMGLETGISNAAGNNFIGTTRTGAAGYNAFIGTNKTAVSSTSSAPDGTIIKISTRNVGGTNTGFATRKWSIIGFSNQTLSDSEMASIKATCDAYNTAVR